MRATRSILVSIVLVACSLGLPGAASARTSVDPTSLTPPLKPSRVCWQLGPYVQCDTSDVNVFDSGEVGDLTCGTLYEFGTRTSHSTRWYQDGLIVRRQIQQSERGYFSLSPDGSGPTVDWLRDFSWNEEFAIPGDIDSAIRVIKGTTLRVPALGASLMEAGWALPDSDILRGRFEDDEAAADLLCPLLTAA
jgi:hypothetical protein